ncbi:hypothetical protein [Klebsiella michiganensis]|uniref:hypothetical protein n=1 Tax=Klebsiella michiganensis TaxID=1134687 RepID=UPI000668A467|nr:hypothetical protein [Klebsiella michiganensis]MCF0027986.1 hypothetical protein [Klebsiella michiganensis]TXV05696.1 hypothetical protein D4M92_13215 [Klebsiella michiganensis]STR66212.1 Uncharacterised protein [Klebsiella michiganensis]HDS8140909.1 hypothetical protein [Klebsiella michiganensis]HDT1977494.1 hypothetical protein [Klebsiella michiganensis]
MEIIKIWKSFLKHFKQKKLDSAVVIYGAIAIYLIPYKFPLKSYLVAFLFISILIFACTQELRLKEYIGFFVRTCNDHLLTRFAGILSLTAWSIFLLLLLSANVFLNTITYWLAILFSLLILISSILTVLDIARNNTAKTLKIIGLAVTVFSGVFTFTSSYSASVFWQISNLELSSSPWLEYCWKATAFLMFFLWLSQPICYGLFITYGDKAKGYRIFTLTGAFIMSVFLFLLVPQLFGDAAYYVLNRTINFEWRDEAKCGELKVKNKNEKYFGFNTDKYTVFYSDKNDKWGFYELTCQKGSNRKDSYAVEYLPEYNIPAWLK